MAEVRVIARAIARKGKEDQLKALLQGMLAPTHAEPGCRLYELYESEERGRFYFYEVWDSRAALEQHVASTHYKHLEIILQLYEIGIPVDDAPCPEPYYHGKNKARSYKQCNPTSVRKLIEVCNQKGAFYPAINQNE